MMAPTHFLTGCVAGYMAWPTIPGAILGGIAGLLPDLDEPGSYLGRRLPVISVPMSRVAKHRTLTHSLFLWLVLTAVVWTVFGRQVGSAFGWGYFSHVAADMLAGRVQLFWPFPVWIGIRVPETVVKIEDIALRMVATLICGVFLYQNLVWGVMWTKEAVDSTANKISKNIQSKIEESLQHSVSNLVDLGKHQ